MTDLQPSTTAPNNKRGAPFGNTNAAYNGNPITPVDTSSPKRGAPYGNVNALTHGFYSRHLNPYSLEGLEEIGPNTLKDEIEIMRVFARKVAELGENITDLQESKSLLHILSIATSAINRLVRTHVHIPNPEDDPAFMLKQALSELEEEWPEYKKMTDRFKTPEQIAEVDARIAARQLREEEARLQGEFVDENGIPYPLDGAINKLDENEQR